MSGASETTLMTGREQFTATQTIYSEAGQTRVSPQPQLDQEMRMNYATDGSAAYRPMGLSPPLYHSISDGATRQAMSMSSGEQKRKRGRPRKYGVDGSMPIVMAAGQQAIPDTSTQSQMFSPLTTLTVQHDSQLSASLTVKKARGRPLGSLNKKQRIQTLGSTGIGFVPHIINVKAGEDVSAKIMAFSQNGPRAVCILSCNGAISNVTLCQAASSGGTATYEGRFDILSLSGSFLLSEVAGQKSRTGGLSITLAGTDGRVLGGCVAGLLIAASPVQVIVGSFVADGRKELKSANYMEPCSAALKVHLGGVTGASSSPSRGTLSESSGGAASPLNLSSGACNNSNNNFQGMSGMPWK